MSELFDNPVLIEVTAAEGRAVSFIATHRQVKTPRRTDYDNVAKSIAEHLATVSRKAGGKPIGAVVFNAAVTQGMEPLGFLVADESGMRDADKPGVATFRELSPEQEAHWTREHKVWKRTNPFPRRRVLETAPPAPPSAARHSPQDQQPWEDIPTVDDDGFDAEAVSRLTPAVRRAPGQWEPSDDPLFTQPSVDRATDAPLPLVTRDGRDRQAAPLRPLRASDLPSLMDRGKNDQDAQDGPLGALNRLGIGFHFPPSKDEQYRRNRMNSILAGWKDTRFATVVNEKGGTCKTPTAMLLAAALAIHGRGSVILRDGNPTGNAHERGEFRLPLGVRADGSPYNDEDLARWFISNNSRPLDDTTMAQFLHFHTTDRYGLVATADSGEDEDQQMETDEVDATYEAITPHASAVVTDTSNHPFDRRDRMVLQRTDQLLIPITTYGDKENGARKTAIRLEKRNEHCEQLVANAVVVVHTAEASRAHRREAEAMQERWGKVARHVRVVPFDPHMGSNSLRFHDLALPTQSAMLDVAAAVADGFRSAE